MREEKGAVCGYTSLMILLGKKSYSEQILYLDTRIPGRRLLDLIKFFSNTIPDLAADARLQAVVWRQWPKLQKPFTNVQKVYTFKYHSSKLYAYCPEESSAFSCRNTYGWSFSISSCMKKKFFDLISKHFAQKCLSFSFRVCIAFRSLQ